MTGGLIGRQAKARDEWMRLCDTLELAQGDELAKSCRNRFQFIKTYQVYGAKYPQIEQSVRSAAAKGNFTFFSDRGVPTDVMDMKFARRLLEDWRHKIEAKKQRLAEVFQLKYHWRIERIEASGEYANELNAATPMHQEDALMEMSGLTLPTVTAHDISGLQAEISQLRKQLDDLTAFVKSELEAIKKTRLS